MPYPNYVRIGGYINPDPYYWPEDDEPTDEELGWDDDIPVNVDGEIDEDPT